MNYHQHAVMGGGDENKSAQVKVPEYRETTNVELLNILREFWNEKRKFVRELILEEHDFRSQMLPLARVKRIMKIDEDVKMISAEAPLIFAKACEIFVQEVTLRAWHTTQKKKRRTLQRLDVTKSVRECEQFDFLIDIIPREELRPSGFSKNGGSSSQQSSEYSSNSNIDQNIEYQGQADEGQMGIPGMMNMTQEQMQYYWAQQQQVMEMMQAATAHMDPEELQQYYAQQQQNWLQQWQQHYQMQMSGAMNEEEED